MRNRITATAVLAAICVAAAACAQDVRPASDGRTADDSRSIQTQPGTPSALAAVLTRSCGDCHTRTMVRRWFTRVPPFSAIMARGAREGRKAVDFSEWTRYSPEQQRALLLTSCTDAKAGRMPMKSYLRFRGDARLSPADVETICSAAAPAVAGAGAAAQSRTSP